MSDRAVERARFTPAYGLHAVDKLDVTLACCTFARGRKPVDQSRTTREGASRAL